MLAAGSPKLNPGALFWLIVGLHLAVTCVLAWQLNIWTDEAFSLHTSGAGPRFAFQQALRFEMQPPLYFVGLSVWRAASGGIFWARLLSVLCAASAIPATVALARRLLPRVPPAAVAAAVAFNPFVVHVAVDIRLYAFAMLLSVLLLLCFWDGYVEKEGRRGARAAYLLLSVAALYTQYYMGFLLVANAIVLVVFRRWRNLWSYAIGMCVVLACFSPMLLIVPWQFAAHTETLTAPAAPVVQRAREVYWTFLSYVLPAQRSYPSLTLWLSRLLILGGGAASVWKWREIRTGRLALLSLLAAMSGAFIWVRGVAGAGLTNWRHTVVLFVPSVLLAFAFVDIPGSQRLRRLWVAIIVVLGLANIAETYAPMAKTGDWKRVASYLMAAEKPGQPVVTFVDDAALPLRHYYNGLNRIVPLPADQGFATYDLRASVLHDEEMVRAALLRSGAGTADIWLVTRHVEPFLDVDVHPEILERFVDRCYATMSDQPFFGSRVRFLRRLPECTEPPPTRQ